MKKHINLNDHWKYSNIFGMEMTKASHDDIGMEEVRLPHTNVETPFNYFDEKIYQFISCYRRHIKAEEEWKGKQILLTFEGVGHVANVYLNGKLITTHFGGYTAFSVDLGAHLTYGEENILAVEVDSRESCNIPPFGNVIDYLTYGGIYREVYLDIKESVSIEDAFIITKDAVGAIEKDILQDNDNSEVELQLTLHGWKENQDLRLKHNITDLENNAIYASIASIVNPVERIRFCVNNIKKWNIEHPNLYQLHLELYYIENECEILLDEKIIRFGFRTCEFKEDGFYLNHRKIKLIGLNRHQSFPYVGYAMPKRMQQRDAEILKKELQVNAVRTSHYPQSKHFIERCDELGLLVFTELPGWQHIGDEQWKGVACEQVKEMVLQYRNHPSIILWGVRINESQDDDEFYQKTNHIAHQLDSSRQTGGVRYLKKSNLLEDVYTYNDFLHNGLTKGVEKKEDVTSNKKAPYLVTEYNGHMFPTKAFDNEEYRLNHALRHARVINDIFGQEGVAGGFGWCMFDYNTHKDFGSGDKICYHGVMDMFRNPKLAASVYASQNDLANVCEVSSSLDIGDHPAGNIKDIYVFTNADSVKLYKNDVFIKEFFPNKAKYPSLPHPPILIDDFIGELLEKEENYSHKSAQSLKKVLFAVKHYGQNNLPIKYKLKMALIMLKEHINLDEGVRLYYKYIGSWGGAATTFRFEAIKDNKVVKVVDKKPASNPHLQVITESTTMKEEETYDVTEVRIQAVNEEGNHLPYYQEPISLEAWGAIELIGPNIISLKGGTAGAYVKTKGMQGDGGLIIQQREIGKLEIKFQVIM